MSFLLRLLCAVTVLLVLAAASWSYPTLYGDTGLILVPTADVVPVYQFDLAADYSSVKTDAGDFSLYPIRLTYGIGKNTEVSIMFAEARGDNPISFDARGATVKVALLKEDIATRIPGLAVGARTYKLSNADDTSVVEAYTALSKVLVSRGDQVNDGYNLRLHVGASYLNFSGTPSGDFLTIFAGMNYKRVNGTSLAVDFLPELEQDGVTVRETAVSAVFRHPLSEHFLGEVGMTQPFGVGNSGAFFAGFNYHFGEKPGSFDDPILY